MGISPHFSLPTNPRVRARSMIARTLSSPKACWVTPIDQTNTAVSARPTISANSAMSSVDSPDSASNADQSRVARWAANRSKPTVCRSTKSRSINPRSTICRSVPNRNAMSPPTFTWKKRSATLVPNRALSRLEGTQYLSIPGSR